MADLVTLTRQSAFAAHVAALPAATPGTADVLVSERTGLGIVTLMAGAAGNAALTERLAAQGITLGTGPTAIVTGATTAIGTGPASWLLLTDDAAADWPATLADRLAGIAGVVDQSSGYAVLRLSGPAARALLQRGPFIDLHADAFGPGAAAVTLIAHIGVILWQRDAAPTFEIALFRSFADSFWHWLETAAAGAGLTLARIA